MANDTSMCRSSFLRWTVLFNSWSVYWTLCLTSFLCWIGIESQTHKVILEQLCAKMSPEQLRANDLATLKVAFNYTTSEVRKLQSKQEGILWFTKFKVWLDMGITSRRYSKRFGFDHVMLCIKGGLALGGMIRCEICLHPCSRMYVMMSRSKRTCRP